MQFSFILVVCVLSSTWVQSTEQYYDQKLKTDLLKDYKNYARPTDGQLNLQIAIKLVSITEVNQIKNMVNLAIYLRLQWYDPRLVWNPDDYGGLTYVTSMPKTNAQKIWTPTLGMEQSTGKIFFPHSDPMMYIIYHDGYVYISQTGYVEIMHTFTLDQYPDDKQTIVMNILSLIESKEKLLLVPWQNDNSNRSKYPLAGYAVDFMSNLAWGRAGLEAEIGEKQLMDQTISTFKVSFVLDRKGQTFFNIIIVPGLMIVSQCLNSYFIRLGDNLRIQFTVSQFLAIILYTVLFKKYMPFQDDLTVYEKFFISLASCGFAVLAFILFIGNYKIFYDRKQNAYLKEKNDRLYLKYKMIYKRYKKDLKKQRKIKLEQEQNEQNEQNEVNEQEVLIDLKDKGNSRHKSVFYDSLPTEYFSSYASKTDCNDGVVNRLSMVKGCINSIMAAIKRHPDRMDRALMIMCAVIFLPNYVSILSQMNEFEKNSLG